MAYRQVRVLAHHDQIASLCDLVQEFSQQEGFERSDSYALSLAVAEACENIIHHGYGGETDKIISMIVAADSGNLSITLRDDAPPFNASLAPDQLSWDEDNPPVGGLGLHIIHKVMDVIHYTREGNNNILEMVRKTGHRHEE